MVTVQAITSSQVHQAVSRIGKYTEAALTQTGVPGLSIAIVFQDQVIYAKGFGVRAVNTSLPVTADTVFQLASMSKPLAATVVAMLVSDGLVTWDDTANSLDSTIVLSDPWVTQEVTIRDFFCHRSGLYGDAGNDLETVGFNQSTILERLRYLAPGGPFRAHYSYSNFGLTAGAVAAATTAGQPWPILAQDKLYSRLRMSSTSSTYADFISRSNKASLHVPADSTANGTWILGPKRDPDAQSPAGGVSSSAADLAQWLRLELANGTWNGEQIISSTAVLETHDPQINRGPDPMTGYPSFNALGWVYDVDPSSGLITLSHAGAFSNGARTLVRMIPAENIGIVVLCNAFPTGVPEAVAYTFLDYVRVGHATQNWLSVWDALYNQLNEGFAQASAPFVHPPAIPAPSLNLSAYTGNFYNAYAGNASVKANGSGTHLDLNLGPSLNMTLPLTHRNRDLFLSYPAPEAPTLAAPVTFSIGPDGTAAEVVIDVLNGGGQGVLTRVA